MRYIIIMGGELFNKGAQSMTFTLVNELRNRNIDNEIILFSNSDYKRDKSEKKKYKFKIEFFTKRLILEILTGVDWFWMPKTDYKGYNKRIVDILKNADMVFDISGYALSSQRGFRRSLKYMLYIMMVRKFQIPLYIMPQSFGPFKYKSIIKKSIIYLLMKKHLTFPKLVFAREREGYEYIKPFTGDNLELNYDIVLQNKGDIDINNIFHENYSIYAKLDINIESVGLIPNIKVIKHGEEQCIFKYYQEIICYLLSKGKSIYVLRHSTEDLNICQKIKQMFQTEEKVILLEDDFNSLELKDIISQFKFIIASRYHAIIHAYKKGIPVIAFGWATKYKELLHLFSQEQYLFDVREVNDIVRIKESIDKMICREDIESNIINNKVKQIESDSIFNEIFNNIMK